MVRFILLASITFFSFVNSSYAESVSIFGTLKNGSNGGIGKADSIRLLALQGAMLPLAELGPQYGSFRFPKMDVPEGSPLLVQVVYKGVNYNKIIPPVDKFRNSAQEVIVYDTTDIWEKISIKSLMQIIREKNGIRIYKLFLIDNSTKPSKSFLSQKRQIEYFVPTYAKEIFAQVQQPGSKMAIPLGTPEGKRGGKILDRALLPGVSELQVSYLIPNEIDMMEERLLLEGEAGEAYPIFVKPQDMEFELISGGALARIEKDIPPGLGAYTVTINANPKVIRFKLNGGKPLPATLNGNPEVVNGTILTSWDTSLFAVLGFGALLFSLSFVFVYKKIPIKESKI